VKGIAATIGVATTPYDIIDNLHMPRSLLYNQRDSPIPHRQYPLIGCAHFLHTMYGPPSYDA